MSVRVTHHPAVWGGKKLAYPDVPPDGAKFSASVVAGDQIFVSGDEGANDVTMQVETDVFEEQMVIALEKARACMEQAGSTMDNVIKMAVLLTDRLHCPAMRRTESEYYRRHAPMLVVDPPASTVMVVQLGKPEYLVELDVAGLVPRE
jgi:2-iminobutanoate/2-iminopropanoate deaminase